MMFFILVEHFAAHVWLLHKLFFLSLITLWDDQDIMLNLFLGRGNGGREKLRVLPNIPQKVEKLDLTQL